MGVRAVFFDRDGVLNYALCRDGKAYAPLTLEEFLVVPEAKEVIRTLVSSGFLIFVFSNQPDVARGTLPMELVHSMNERLLCELGGPGMVREIFICPHDKQDGCACRKPKPGMLSKASQKWGVDLARSFVVGDRRVDVEAGKSAGCKTVIVDASYNQEVTADYRSENLKDAVNWILKQKEE